MISSCKNGVLNLILSEVVTCLACIKINSDNPFFFVKGGSVYCNLTREFLSIMYVHFIKRDNILLFVKEEVFSAN